jgi:hypothetical protein
MPGLSGEGKAICKTQSCLSAPAQRLLMKISTRMRSLLLLSLIFPLFPISAQSEVPRPISHEIIGRKVWINECDGTVAGLTSWNGGEAFPSLGIGHFIWYPAGKEGPFEESFPRLIAYLKEREVGLPKWLDPLGPCPWPDRRAFMADFLGPRLSGLRKFLASTVAEQSDFLFERLRLSEAQLGNGLAAQDAGRLKRNFQLLSDSTTGTYALVDYVNFKGEGTKPSESYHGRGWGLRQVLLAMKSPDGPADAPGNFAFAAASVLRQRVKLSPPERDEAQYLPGWLDRTASYGEGLGD